MDRAAFATLARDDASPRVSVYVSTGPHGTETLVKPIRAKNALREAAQGLAERGVSPADAERLLAPARERLEDSAQWRANGPGFAVFAGTEGVRAESQPEPVEDFVVVADRYHLRPYLTAMEQDDRYYVLAVGRGGFHFYSAEGPTLRPLDVNTAAESVGDVRAQYDFDDDLGWHASTGGGRSAPAGPGGGAKFHALGQSPEDFDDVLLDQFLTGVAKGVSPFLQEGGLVVLAGGPREVGWLRNRLGRASVADEIVPQRRADRRPRSRRARVGDRRADGARRARPSRGAARPLPGRRRHARVPRPRRDRARSARRPDRSVVRRPDAARLGIGRRRGPSHAGERAALQLGRRPAELRVARRVPYGRDRPALPEDHRASAGPASACFRW